TVAELEALVAARERALAERDREIAEARVQQTATADVLAAISRSATDLRGVLDTICESAARLCACRDALILRPDGGGLVAVAQMGGVFAGAVDHARQERTPLDQPGLSV